MQIFLCQVRRIFGSSGYSQSASLLALHQITGDILVNGKRTGLFPAEFQALDGNITFFRSLDHILDKIGFCHGFSGLQIQSQISGPVHLIVDTEACGNSDFCCCDCFRGSIGKLQGVIGFHVIRAIFDTDNTGFQIFDSRFGSQFRYSNGDPAADAV